MQQFEAQVVDAAGLGAAYGSLGTKATDSGFIGAFLISVYSVFTTSTSLVVLSVFASGSFSFGTNG